MARNPVSPDPVSRHVPEREKLLQAGKPVLGALYDWRQRLARHKYSGFPHVARGDILLSAMLFGALLDWQALDRLCAVLSEGSGPPENGWLDFTTAESLEAPAMTRRWLVDRHTRKLWDRSTDLLSSLQYQHPPNGAREAFFADLGLTPDEMQLLHAQACYWWRQRLPPVLATHVEGFGPARAVPRENWERLLTGKKGPGAASKLQASRQGVGEAFPAPEMPAALNDDLLRIRRQLTDAMSPAVATSQRAATARNLLRQLGLQTDIAQCVRDWFCECLQYGYDHDANQRSKRGRIISPSTLKGDLSRLRAGVLSRFMQTQLHPQSLIQLYADELPDDLRQDHLESKFRTIRRFHKWLATNRGYPALTFRFTSTGPQPSVWARLISEAEYDRALALAGRVATGRNPAALRVMLILGFRAGLRPQELLALQPGDFRLGADGLVLIVKPNHHSKLKTANARRLLPLHLLLSQDEQVEVAKLVRSRQAMRGRATVGAMLLHEACTPQDVAAKGRDIEKQAEALLAAATGDPEARLYDLRHSFASFILATLLLPEGRDARLASTVGPACISKARRDRLAHHLLGPNVQGRSVLYAVSFLMGHASPDWTLVYYLHLLDWSAAQYVARSAFDGLTQPATKPPATVEGTATEMALKATLQDTGQGMPSDWPEWPIVVQALSELIDEASPPLVAARSGIDQQLLTAWRMRLRRIVGYKTRQGLQRHRFVASTRLASAIAGHDPIGNRPRFLLPRDDRGKQVIATVWSACKARQGGSLGHPDVTWALQQFITRADPARCDVPLLGIGEAVRYVGGLMKLGLPADGFRMRLQQKGSPVRSPLLGLPAALDDHAAWEAMVAAIRVNGLPFSGVSRLRISIVNDQPDAAQAMPSHRVALMLAAIAAEFPLP